MEEPGSCRICGNEAGNTSFVAHEMMLASREPFDYFECRACGTLQIAGIPGDLSRWYPPDYYAYTTPYRTPPVRRWLKRRVARHALGRTDPIGALITSRRGRPREVGWVARAGLGLDAAILDVGAGNGQVLLALRDYGLRRLLGVDPFLERDLEHAGVRVLRRSMEEVDGPFDLIMFHHSFEHVPDPAATLEGARDRLSPGGAILVRMPVVAASWARYGPDWVELDAPRHLHVLTARALELLARRSGLRVTATEHDTDGFELWGSEQYRRGIPLTDPRSHAFGGAGSVFDKEEMRRFEAEARELNRTGQAGRAAFWLTAN